MQETFPSRLYRWSVWISQGVKWRLLVPLLAKPFLFPSVAAVGRFCLSSVVKAENIYALYHASPHLACDLVLTSGNQWVVPASS